MNLSIIVVVTNNDAFKHNALISFNNAKKVADTVCIPVFNTFKKIHLMSALNMAMSRVRSDVVAIIHQDALLSQKCWHDTMASFLDDRVGVVGYAGVDYSCSYSDCHESGLPIDSQHIIGSVRSIDGTPIWDGRYSGQVHSPDEFAFCIRNLGMPSFSIQRSHHHYAADISIRYRMAGYKVIAIASNAVHDIRYSTSTGGGQFLKSLIDLRSRWSNEVDEHLMPHSCWSSNVLVSRMPIAVKSTSSTFGSTYQLIRLNE